MSYAACQNPLVLEQSLTSLLLSQLGTEGCAFGSQPLQVEAMPGQTLNVTLYDFSRAAADDVERTACRHEYGELLDVTSAHARPLCARTAARRQHVMSSDGHRLELTLSSQNFANQPLLLQLQGDVSTEPYFSASMP